MAERKGGVIAEVEFGLPTMDQIYGAAAGVGTDVRMRQWLDELYDTERRAPRRVAAGMEEARFRRQCRVDYLCMRLGVEELEDDQAACEEAAAWFGTNGMPRMRRRAELRAQVARELAETMAA